MVELALALPLLLVLFAFAVDFARAYYSAQVVTDAARAGAFFAANPDLAGRTDYVSVEEAVVAACGGLQPPPTVVVREGVSTRGHECVEVTVTYPFRLLTPLIARQSTVSITRTVRARLYPSALIEADEE